MKLFGGAVALRPNKQDTVTTSSTEAELQPYLKPQRRQSIFLV